MDDLIKVGDYSQFPPGEGRKCLLRGEEIGIFNLGDKFKAVSNKCPHKGGPLSDGMVLGSEVICPIHSLKVNLTNGDVASEDKKTKVFDVLNQNGEIYIRSFKMADDSE
jgi:nitrite reductase (NADH) small subunit